MMMLLLSTLARRRQHLLAFLPISSSSAVSPFSRSSSAMPDSHPPQHHHLYDWCVVGAGPAGIAAVGLLLDSGAPSIAWIDPAFQVGDFGTRWRRVSSNTTVGLFLRFYRQCRSFDFPAPGKQYPILSIPEKHTCFLDIAAEPLRDITQTLRGKVSSFQASVRHLREKDARWECILSPPPPPANSSPAPPDLDDSSSTLFPASIVASNVILATGALPRTLPFHSSVPSLQVIPLTLALDPDKLAASVTPSDTVAVFGSSHSAIILIRHLLENTGVQKVVNFYRDPLRYALYMGDWILFDDTGLKGDTARWSREHLHGDLPERLVRLYSDERNVSEQLPKCTKVIYATGFERREIPDGVEGLAPRYAYNAHCGIIAPGLFGCGIGYPEERTDRYGNVELRVGLWKFMDYLQNVIPLWKQYSVPQGIGQPKGAPGTQEKTPNVSLNE